MLCVVRAVSGNRTNITCSLHPPSSLPISALPLRTTTDQYHRDQADGLYDTCVVATNLASGLQAAKIHRLRLPESTSQYDGNRPSSYTNVDAALAAKCKVRCY